VSELLKLKSAKGHIIDVKASTPLSEAIKILSEHEVLSVPVRAEDSIDYVGVIDVLDILQFILKTYSKGKDVESMQWSSWCTNIDELMQRGEAFCATPVSEIAQSLSTPVYPEGSVFELIEVFAQGIHRVPIWKVSGHLTYVNDLVSQSDVLAFLFRHRFDVDLHGNRLSGDLFNTPIKSLQGLQYSKNVITMSYSAQAIHAFWLMYFNKVYGIAIVDHDGHLVANLSASDIRGIGKGRRKFSSLLLPVPQFFRAYQIQTAPLTCTQDTTFGSLIMKFGFYHVHRLWVVDETEKPIGLISLTDLMKYLSSLEKIPS